ncbi:PREDICTED: uncharacterized protein LOC105145134 [Acromyrmex echinatior]|uniref:uncharacterized protein LOC105145134 n=1 Tax=Acromyrmex echinatior TaxID=103372 RepID=UPI000580EC04|nr:PREDICTED: uncharacterized protein LOC105145134 [Acromyrmex echinatior]XP_011052817.1 PREDICTED: uncharacterized protein LOC105145134 [Acromyrmex echinatior]
MGREMWWGVCPSKVAGRQFAPSSLSGKTCLCVKCVFRLCNTARWSVRLNSAIKFCVRLGKNAIETFQMLQEAFKDDCISRSQSGRWHKAFKEGREERMSKSRIETMLIVFFDVRGIVHFEFAPQGETVNSVFYLEVLKRLKRRVARVRADIKDAIKLHHDNDPQPHGLHRCQLPGPEQHPGGPPAPLQSRLGSVRLFFVSPSEERAERKALGVRGKHPKACYNVPKRHSRRGVSACLPGVADTSPQVY